MTNDDRPGVDRRTALKRLAAVAGSTAFAGVASATPERQRRAEVAELGERVPPGRATEVASAARRRYARRAYASWRDASVGRPQTYHTELELNTHAKHVPTAYVFPVESSDETVGYLTVSAREQWSPVLEASTADPPAANRRAVTALARRRGERLTGTFLYRGAATYSVELESGKQLYLNNGLTEDVTTETPRLAVEKHADSVSTQWSSVTEVTTDDVRTRDYSSIYGVEPWDANGGSGQYAGSDGGDANTSTPYLYGDTADPWDRWDGCSPFAGAQILMYHEGVSVSDVEAREEIADRLHVLMGTDEQGWTDYLMPRVGISEYPSSQLDHDYTGHEEVWLSKGLFRSEVDSDRPFILNVPGSQKKSASGPYSGHSIVVYGYYETSNSFDVIHYNSWDANSHWMQYGNWPLNTWATRVVKS